MTSAVRIPGVILAGGLSRRMGGGDKSLNEIGGTSLLQHVIDRLTPQAWPIALNANGPAERFAQYGLPVLQDPVQGFVGPLAGILAGMSWAAEQGAEHVVSVAADTPFFPETLVDDLKNGLTRGPIVLAATPHSVRGSLRQPTFGLWPVALQDDLRAALETGMRKIVQWTDGHRATEVLFEMSQGRDPFFNVNTPEDLEAARRLFAGGIS